MMFRSRDAVSAFTGDGNCTLVKYALPHGRRRADFPHLGQRKQKADSSHMDLARGSVTEHLQLWGIDPWLSDLEQLGQVSSTHISVIRVIFFMVTALPKPQMVPSDGPADNLLKGAGLGSGKYVNFPESQFHHL